MEEEDCGIGYAVVPYQNKLPWLAFGFKGVGVVWKGLNGAFACVCLFVYRGGSEGEGGKG